MEMQKSSLSPLPKPRKLHPDLDSHSRLLFNNPESRDIIFQLRSKKPTIEENCLLEKKTPPLKSNLHFPKQTGCVFTFLPTSCEKAVFKKHGKQENRLCLVPC